MSKRSGFCLLGAGQSAVLFALTMICSFSATEISAKEPAKSLPEQRPFDVNQRLPWTTGTIEGTPDAADPYSTEDAFPGLKLTEPLAVSRVPGSARFGVATRPGKIFTFDIRSDVTQADLMLDIGRTIYGFAFHPQFVNNGYFYVTWVRDPLATEDDGSVLSRFQVKRTGNPEMALRRS
jgi:hypothetical protein